MILKPVQSRRVFEDAADQIRRLIFGREFPAGSKLPAERDLARRLEVHRSSLREALKRLEAEGLVDIRRGDGAYVRDFTREANLSSLEAFLIMPEGKRQEVFRGIQEFRILVQKEMARLAALRRARENLDEISRILEQEQGEADPVRFRELDWSFALAVAHATKNVTFTLALNSVRDLHERWGSVYFSVPGTIRISHRFHRLIARAIAKGDDRRAASLMERLLEYSNPILIENIPKLLLPEGTAP